MAGDIVKVRLPIRLRRIPFRSAGDGEFARIQAVGKSDDRTADPFVRLRMAIDEIESAAAPVKCRRRITPARAGEIQRSRF